MTTQKTSISLPVSLLENAQKQWAAKGFTSLSAYIQHLLRQDLDAPDTVADDAANYEGKPDLVKAISSQVEAMNELIKRMDRQEKEKRKK